MNDLYSHFPCHTQYLTRCPPFSPLRWIHNFIRSFLSPHRCNKFNLNLLLAFVAFICFFFLYKNKIKKICFSFIVFLRAYCSAAAFFVLHFFSHYYLSPSQLLFSGFCTLITSAITNTEIALTNSYTISLLELAILYILRGFRNESKAFFSI